MKKFISYFLFLIPMFTFAQEKVNIEFRITDQQQKPIDGASVLFNSKTTFTDDKGIARFSVKKGEYTVKVKHIIYKDFLKKISCIQDDKFGLKLKENTELLQEVVVTAKEKEGITSTSVIDREAMEHLQPSSFSDLVSLLPGKSMKAPVLNRSNHLTLREVGIRSEKYNISSLGISFMVDEIPINSNSNLQKTVGTEVRFTPNSFTTADKKRNTIRKGVDMRSISTDEIEKVEIVRGIPSVKYGDLSSGLVKITRKKGLTKWSGRMKSDGFSKLFYLGKGFDFKKSDLKLNIGFDYFNAKADPRNTLENYKRYTTSIRTEKVFKSENPITWNLNLDYTGSFDEEKVDPDEVLTKEDSYISSYQNFRVSNTFQINFPEKIISNINFRTSYSESIDQIKQKKFIQAGSIVTIPINRDEGDFYGIYIEPQYLSDLLIDGKPVDFLADLSSKFKFELANIRNNLMVGVNFSYSKNKGLGQVYNPKRPPSFSGMKIRQRAFKDIPAIQLVSFYLEDNIKWNLGSTKFIFQAGVRSNSLINLNENYLMSSEIYLDPRFNLKIDFPKIELGDKSLGINLTAGYGKQTKLPNISMLYPQNVYQDYIQLNYYHNNKDYRQVHYRTVIFPQINYEIIPAFNIKKELRLGLEYDYRSLYMTFFKEKMTSGFRQMTDYYHHSYRRYNTTALNHNNITAPPLVENLPYVEQAVVELSSKESNGSAIEKQGIEFQYSGKRYKTINTRFTLNGAWFQTRYYNSLPFYRTSKEVVLGGKLNYNLGYYKEEEVFFKENFKSTLTADTYLPLLGLTTSLRFDMNLYSISKDEKLNGMPTHYVNKKGEKLPYTSKEQNDPYLNPLTIKYSPSLFNELRTPFIMRGHLKITKKFYRNFRVSMYVNNLFEYSKDFNIRGRVLTRKGRYEPYFGMEMNLKF